MKKIKYVSLLLIGLLVSCGESSSLSTPVAEKEIVSIEIAERQVQNAFTINETIDLTGLKVKVNYSDSTFAYVGPASLTYPEKVSSTSEKSITLGYKGHEVLLEGLEFRNPNDIYFEAESNKAYWSKPNNHNRNTFFVTKQHENAHGGSYIDGMSKECFSLSFLFYSDEVVDAKFSFGSDLKTITYSQHLTPFVYTSQPLSEIYEFHVNGEKVQLEGEVESGEWYEFRDITLGKAKLRKGLNTVSLTHILRNGENGNIDYIKLNTITNVELTNYSRQLIEAEDMQVSGGDHKKEGNNASQTGANKDFDNVGNRANGQTGWLMTTINSAIDKTAALYINFGLCSKFNLSEWDIYLNNERINYVDVLIPHHFWEGIAWKDWNEFYVCDLKLKAGENLLKIEKADASTDGTNIDYIAIVTSR